MYEPRESHEPGGLLGLLERALLGLWDACMTSESDLITAEAFDLTSGNISFTSRS